ncbi:MAG: type II toxin-antitoxin system VapC family toxin [Clostridia bacterium]|jgi:predicted nucleic acid-binding protein|nr:type II toxin-antitoxin system VapC family toxin [Clostridia bacterium]
MHDRILLDTGVLVDYFRARRKSRLKGHQAVQSAIAVALIEGALRSNIDLYISVHTFKELLQYPQSLQEEHRITTYLPRICHFIATTRRIAAVAGYLSRMSAEYRTHHIEDCYIAATAIVRDLPLYTTNPDDFQYVPHPKLRVIKAY